MTLEEKMEELARAKMEEGSLEEKNRIAKTMKDKGFLLEKIAKITRLTKEEIEKL